MSGVAAGWCLQTVRVARSLARRCSAPLQPLAVRWRAHRTARTERLLQTEASGARLYYPSSSIIGQAIAAGEVWEPTLARAIDILLPSEEPLLIAEVGSNIGATLAQMISERPSANYVCFEPAERFRTVLKRNVRENGWDNVQIEDALVGANGGTVTLFTNTSTASAARRDYGGHVFLGAEIARSVRLDEYFATVPRLDFVKSDTDGFDVDVLLGARELLERLAPVLYFELAPFLVAEAGRNATELLEYLAGLGYHCLLVYTQAGDLLACSDDVREVIKLADDHRYVDVLTAARPEHVARFPEIARVGMAARGP